MWVLDYTLNTMTHPRAHARGGRGDRRRDRGAREHRAAPRGGRGAARGGLEGHARDRLRGHRGDALDGRGVRAGGVRRPAWSGTSSPSSARPWRSPCCSRWSWRSRSRPMLAARIPPPKEREHGSIYHRLEMWLHAARDELPPRARLDARASRGRRSASPGPRSSSRSGALRRQLGTEFFPPADVGRFFVAVETPPGTLARGHARGAEEERGVDLRAARGGGRLRGRRASRGPKAAPIPRAGSCS